MTHYEGAPPLRHALYYPFHLCHDRTLERLLEVYRTIHFREYMALQLTGMTGTTACQDHMGDRHQGRLHAGRIVQGHPVSGPLDDEMTASIDRDLADPVWRDRFHAALGEDRRFQRGLFDLSHSFRIGQATVPGPAALLRLLERERGRQPVTVERVRGMSHHAAALEEGYHYEYGFALITTAAALRQTIRLCHRHGLEAVTDSEPHFHLLSRTCARESLALANHWLPRTGY